MSKLHRFLTVTSSALLTVTVAATLSACNMHVDEKKNGEAKKVDISTPFGDLKVHTEADARDTGLSVYPNSREKIDEGNKDKNSANVNMSFGSFGLKVVAKTYLVDDAPDKVTSFYRSELGKYGKVLECKGGSIGNVQVDKGGDKDDDKELHCDKKGDSDVVELKAGMPKLQRVVAVKPNGKGSEYSLVYVRIQGSEKDPI